MLPSGQGPAESSQADGTNLMQLVQSITYGYDDLYRLTDADYDTGNIYDYDYDPVGNRLQQIIDGNTTIYTYDDANRLDTVDGTSYSFDDNGNLLDSGDMLNTWDAANRLVQSQRNAATVQPIYNGVNDRVGQVVDGTQTDFALDVQGLPEVIYSSDGNTYLHLPGVTVTENSSGELRYLLSDGLGSVRHATDDTGTVIAYNEFDPYGNSVQNGSSPYGFTGEWWQDEVELLHLRARWYMPGTGTFLSRDVWKGDQNWPQTLNLYTYVFNNPANYHDPSGHCPPSICQGANMDPYYTSSPTPSPSPTPTSSPTPSPTPTLAPIILVSPGTIAGLNNFQQQQTGSACGPNSLAMNINLKRVKMGESGLIDGDQLGDAMLEESGWGPFSLFLSYRMTVDLAQGKDSTIGATNPSGIVHGFNRLNEELVNQGFNNIGSIEAASGGTQANLISNINNDYYTSILWTYDATDRASGGHWVSIVGYDPNTNEMLVLNSASPLGTSVERVSWATFNRRWSNTWYTGGSNHYVTIK